jgi:hypothetical protein
MVIIYPAKLFQATAPGNKDQRRRPNLVRLGPTPTPIHPGLGRTLLMLRAPTRCGDVVWPQHVNLTEYTGKEVASPLDFHAYILTHACLLDITTLSTTFEFHHKAKLNVVLTDFVSKSCLSRTTHLTARKPSRVSSPQAQSKPTNQMDITPLIIISDA